MIQRSTPFSCFLWAVLSMAALTACSTRAAPAPTPPDRAGPLSDSAANALWATPENPTQIRNASILQMFYSPRCPHCRRAKAWLESRGVAFKLRDISLEQHRTEFRALGGRGVPTFYLKSRSLQGFDPETLEAFLN